MATVDEATETPEIKKPGRRLVLCFDGTGNHFKGNESDSNVVKLYQMLDRHDKRQFHYYQREFNPNTMLISSLLLTSYSRHWNIQCEHVQQHNHIRTHALQDQ